MKLIVTDTNVFFDIIKIGALPEFFSLDYDVCTTDFVLKEILLSDQREQIKSFIRSKSLTIFELSEIEVDIVRNFSTRRVFKGITDKSVLWKACELTCPLLTGDKKLRSEAEEMGIVVHGSIWVIETLIDNNLILKSIGIKFLENLKVVNGSLPHEIIDNLIKRIKK
jgi:predicted nucleic acid-binding protein